MGVFENITQTKSLTDKNTRQKHSVFFIRKEISMEQEHAAFGRCVDRMTQKKRNSITQDQFNFMHNVADSVRPQLLSGTFLQWLWCRICNLQVFTLLRQVGIIFYVYYTEIANMIRLLGTFYLIYGLFVMVME